MSLLDMLQQRLGGDAVSQISQQLGTDPGTTQTAIAAALPMLVGALARNAQARSARRSGRRGSTPAAWPACSAASSSGRPTRHPA